jgi:mono/diheme cytochrome c family protein
MKPVIGLTAAVLAVAVVAGGYVFFEDAHVAKGRTLFQYYCAHCHGPKGKGDGFNAEFLDPHPRDLTDSREEYLGPQTNEEVYETLSRDIKEEQDVPDEEVWVPATMPTFKYTLSDAERWSIVAFVRTLQKNEAGNVDFTAEMDAVRPKITVAPLTGFAEMSADKRAALAEKGRHLFEKKFVCSSCHRINGKGGQVGPDLSRSGIRLSPTWVYRWIKYPQSIMRKTKMPNFGMSDEEALAITAYLSTVHETAPPPLAS